MMLRYLVAALTIACCGCGRTVTPADESPASAKDELNVTKCGCTPFAFVASPVPSAEEDDDKKWAAVTAILQRDVAEEERMGALEKIVNVGMCRDQIEANIGRQFSHAIGRGPGFMDVSYGLNDDIPLTVLSVGYYPDGEAYYVRYRRDGKNVTLVTDDPVTWNKTKNKRYRQLRRKKSVTE